MAIPSYLTGLLSQLFNQILVAGGGALDSLISSIQNMFPDMIMLIFYKGIVLFLRSEITDIATTGVNNMIANKTDMSVTRNLIIVSLILTTGIGGAIFKIGDFTFAGIGLAAMVGVVLNLILPGHKEEKGSEAK